jgi:hypothetical protein
MVYNENLMTTEVSYEPISVMKLDPITFFGKDFTHLIITEVRKDHGRTVACKSLLYHY